MNTYTTGEVAALCGVRKMTVIRWIERGELAAYQLPGRGDRRIQESDLAAFMRANRMPIPDSIAADFYDILVVDDDAGVVHAIERVLRRCGYRVASALEGFRAGSLLETHRPRLLILDLMMPGTSGLDVLAFLRAERKYPDLRILVVSAAPPDMQEQALCLGADAVLSKPFENAELRGAVQALLAGNPVPAAKHAE